MKYWGFLVLGCISFFLVFSYIVPIVLGHDGEVQILNSASEPVRDGEIEVCGQKFKLGTIDQGKSMTVTYKVRSDSHYRLLVEFNSGKQLAKELGYVTNGRDFKDTLTLRDDDVLLKEQ
jgi:hypothetical protein